VRNLTGRVLPIATNENVTAVVVEPQTVAPGTTERIPLFIRTASFRPDLATPCRPDHGGIQVSLDLEWDPCTRERRRTRVLPLIITA
jgi:hypothetical protein